MKRILLILVCCALCLSMCACDTEVSTSTQTYEESSTPSYSQPESSIVSSTVEEKDIWTVKYYVDNFGQKTDDWYVINNDLFYGKFSDSATTNSSLSVYVLAEGEKEVVDGVEYTIICFVLYEYGKYQVKNIFSEHERYIVQLRDEKGNEFSGYGTVIAKDDRLTLNSDTADKLIEFMKSSDEVQIYIKEKEGMSSYLFTITTGDFFKHYNF